MLGRTSAIAKYSVGTDRTLIPMSTKIAIFVEAPSINAMKSGPTSLHTKSIRRIRAFRTISIIGILSHRAALSKQGVFWWGAWKPFMTYFEGLTRHFRQSRRPGTVNRQPGILYDSCGFLTQSRSIATRFRTEQGFSIHDSRVKALKMPHLAEKEIDVKV